MSAANFSEEIIIFCHTTGQNIAQCRNLHERFEVYMAINMKITILWSMTTCSLAEIYQHFGEIQ
jgi:hypothetical protein